MTAPEDVQQNEDEELVTIDGIQLKKYIYDCADVLAKAQGYEDVKDFIVGSVILNMGAQLGAIEPNYAVPIMRKLDKERCGWGF